MKNERIVDLIIWLVIAIVGLVAAYLCFGILDSQASGKYQGYSVGGAIAGAIVSWSVLTSVYLQVRKSSNELQEYKKRVDELQSKLIRGAPRPEGFDTEVSERDRLVLARPKIWKPKGGTIFDLVLPETAMKQGDAFPAAFRCYYLPIAGEARKGAKKSGPAVLSREDWYALELKQIRDASEFVSSFSHEMIRVGGEPAGVESLKLIARQCVRLMRQRSDWTRQFEWQWELISRDEFAGRIRFAEPAVLTVGRPQMVVLYGRFRQGAVCRVGGVARQTELTADGPLHVHLVDDDVRTARILQLAVENPDTKGVRSNEWTLAVEAPTGNEQAAPAGSPQASVAAGPPPVAPAPGPVAPPAKAAADEEKILYQEIVRMRVICYHPTLDRVYFFDFMDNLDDFQESSDVFNRILATTRFLD
jgi:hypothetical protein